jgi:hypothetical protein
MAGTYNNIFIFFECTIMLVVISLHVDSKLFFEELSKAATLSNDKAHLILLHHKLSLGFHLVYLNRLLLILGKMILTAIFSTLSTEEANFSREL